MNLRPPPSLVVAAAVALGLCSIRAVKSARGGTAVASAAPSASAADAGSAPVSRGIAVALRGNVPVGLGVVLAQDGRVLCPLSALEGRDTVDLRYSDGTHVQAELVQKDRETDLALLRPKSGHFTTGLPPGHAPLADEGIRAWVLVQGQLRPVEVAVLPEEDGGATEDDLAAVQLKSPPPKTQLLGAPLVDADGKVVAMLTHPCPPEAHPCRSPIRAASTTTMRRFLSRLITVDAGPPPLVAAALDAAPPEPASSAGPTAPAPSWLGIRAETDRSGTTHGVRVLAVAPGSPAAKARLHARGGAGKGDLVVAVNGTIVETPEQLAELIASHSAGDELRLLVMSGDRFHDVVVTLEASPADGAPGK